MLYFNCDYLEGCHPAILKALEETNYDQTPGYGYDRWCDLARERIREATGRPDADVRLLVGGTQTNSTVIRSVLRNYQGVISPDTGHITGHEGGAIEASGHKVLTIPATNGKITAEQIAAYVENVRADGASEQLMQPGMVYISHPTEYGTLYSLDELQAIYATCHAYNLPLFIDGARLGYGLTAPGTDVTLKDLAANCDVFYIGGTKVGALFGEAVVINNPALMPGFATTMKQAGAVLAKGRLLGIQFAVLFENDRYLECGRHANREAARLAKAFEEKGYKLHMPLESNQIFLRVTSEQYRHLQQAAVFSTWQHLSQDEIVVRFVTSWATKPENVDALIAAL